MNLINLLEETDMMNSNKVIESENLKELLILCTYNLKGISNKEKIQKYLPIKENGLSIFVEDNKIVIQDQEKKIGEVWLEANTYSNLDILKLITPKYNIECKSNNILELMKYRNNIIAILL